MSKNISWLKGSIPPLITPFRDGAIDFETYGRLIERHIGGGSHGILVNGTTAEPSTLTVDERNALVAFAVKTAKGRIPVVAATGSQSLAETLTLSRAAEDAGADAQLIVTPYYIKPPQRGLEAYFIDVMSRLKTPAMVYHIPGRAGVSMDVQTFRAVRERCDNLVGVKHASTDLGFVTELLSVLGSDFRIFAGLEELCLPMMSVGAVGMMNAVGNILPEKVSALANAVESGNLRDARALHFALFEISQAIFFDTNPIPLKYMMRRTGLVERNEHRSPMVPASDTLEKRLDDVLHRTSLI